jgi:hypothetical protein
MCFWRKERRSDFSGQVFPVRFLCVDAIRAGVEPVNPE